jgi:hypothetical protein
MAEATTRAWCEDRGHPFITYNPWMGWSFCRCGERREQGDHPQDMQAKRDLFHDHPVGAPCRCYLPTR